MDEYFTEEDASSINKVPIRIKSGHIENEALIIETSGSLQTIPFDSIEYICLGMIEEKLTTSDPPKSNMRNMIQGLLGGGDKADKNKKIQPSSRTTHILDIYIKDTQAPFRIDSSSINYKEFLGKISYVSADNFRLLVTNICSMSKQSKFNAPLGTFLTRGKEKPQIFDSRHEFELTSVKKRQELEKEPSWSDFLFDDVPQTATDLTDSWNEIENS